LKQKILKKTRVHLKIFGQNKIEKFEVTCPTKFGEVQNGVKSEKPSQFGFSQNGAALNCLVFLKNRFFIC
jgi:hypothetical protein